MMFDDSIHDTFLKSRGSVFSIRKYLNRRFADNTKQGTSVFSTAGDIVTVQRSALHPGNADALIFLKKNMKL